MTLRPIGLDNSVVGLVHEAAPVALLFRDSWHQISQIVFVPKISDKQALEALRIAASHIRRYAVHRQRANGIFIIETTGEVSAETSRAYLEDGFVDDDILVLDQQELERIIQKIGVEVIHAVAFSFFDVLQIVLCDENLAQLSIDCVPGRDLGYSCMSELTFKVEPPAQFSAWHEVGQPGQGNVLDLYIVPAYHPCMSGKTSGGLINGDTDALIRGEAIRSVHAPAEARLSQKSFSFGTWSQVKHPYRAAGQEITIDVSRTKILSQSGIEELKTFLLAVLGLENTYLAVSGGFRGPHEYPSNVARQAGLRIGTYNGEVRGSEGFCAWAYNVLEQERELEGAYVPRWFKEEGWLAAYGEEAKLLNP